MNHNKTELEGKARSLADQPYEVLFKEDVLSDGSASIMAYHSELPGCQSDGKTREEAEENLKDARFVYIYHLLEDGIDVPAPSRIIKLTLDMIASSNYTSAPESLSPHCRKGRNVLEQVTERTYPY